MNMRINHEPKKDKWLMSVGRRKARGGGDEVIIMAAEESPARNGTRSIKIILRRSE